MNKKQIIDAISLQQECTVLQARDAVQVLFDCMSDTLIAGGRIEIRGFGSFTVRKYEPYIGRNPKSGQLIHVKAKKLPHFKVGKWMAIKLQPDLLEHHKNFRNSNQGKHDLSPEQIKWKIDNPNLSLPEDFQI